MQLFICRFKFFILNLYTCSGNPGIVPTTLSRGGEFLSASYRLPLSRQCFFYARIPAGDPAGNFRPNPQPAGKASPENSGQKIPNVQTSRICNRFYRYICIRIFQRIHMTRHISYPTLGTCSRQIDIELEDGIIRNVTFTGGCHGNTQGIAALVRGMKAADAIARLEGIDCRGKGTSCPDQLAKALRQAL